MTNFRRTAIPTVLAGVAVALVWGAPVSAQVPPETIQARKHFFGAANVDVLGRVRSDRVILSWFSVSNLAMAIDGRVVLLNTYIHKGEKQPGYVPTTTDEQVVLDPEAIVIGHGHFDHANTAGEIAARTGATVIGTPEHCDQAKAQAVAHTGKPATISCIEAVDRGSAPGAEVRKLHPLGPNVRVLALKHLHSAAVPPDGQGHESTVVSGGLPDVGQTLLHPPGPGTVAGLSSSGDEGSSLLDQFHIGTFSLTWHDTVGPLREKGPELFKILDALPPTDVELGSTLGFNDPTNGQRDPVDYLVHIKPKIFYPLHHDFIAEYGVSKGVEGVFRRELAKRGAVPTEIRWLYDPRDYVRPELMTFDVGHEPVTAPGASCLRAGQRVSRKGIGSIALGRTTEQLARRADAAPISSRRRVARWCVQGQRGDVVAVLGAGRRTALVATTARSHATRGIRPGVLAQRVRTAFPRTRRVVPGVLRAGPRSRRLIGVRNGRVRFIAVTRPQLLNDRLVLRRALGLAGLP